MIFVSAGLGRVAVALGIIFGLAEGAFAQAADSNDKGEMNAPQPKPATEPPVYSEPAAVHRHWTVQLLKDIATDQKDLWSSPKDLRFTDATWLVPAGGFTAALMATDSDYSRHLSHNPTTLSRYNNVSNAGTAALAGGAGALWLLSYWNHNAHYHRWVLGIARERAGDVLDVGCGEGLLAQRLASVSRTVTAIDPDGAAIARARERIGALPNVTVSESSFEAFEPGARRFALITFVASLHHMDLGTTLARARDLLIPGGTIAVVGLAANDTAIDWLVSGLALPAVRIGGLLHGQTRDIGVVVAEPRESLGEIRRIVADVLPAASIRRGLYYRYLLRADISQRP